MVAKGLDLPLVTLVGIVSADTALYLPDYRSGELTFQLLAQVSGRAGRSLLGGQVVLQTYDPDHYAIQAASQHDYARFYEQEIRYRQELGYPPFSRLVRALVRSEYEDEARQRAESLHARLIGQINDLGLRQTTLIGPAPCFYSRLNGIYRWQVVARGPDPARLFSDVRSSAMIQVDVDPVSLL